MTSDIASVLIVDDEDSICDIVREELQAQGYVCDTASNANDALVKLERQNYDLALLDIKMPGMSGIDLLRKIAECHQKPAIIMMTAMKEYNSIIEAMKIGASDYIVKPFTLDKLNTSINMVLKNREPDCAVYDNIQTVSDEDYDKSNNDFSINPMNAIACGVDAKVDYYDYHSKIVTEKTIELAQTLGLPKKEIEKWAVARDELYSERNKHIKSLLSKLERNPMAQVVSGLTRPLRIFLKYGEQQN